ncbi:MAG: DUF1501 domain-containing protein, partial [Actinomycetota bacterium]|nr:DUF1501 domain-containing protein [Actinomycetota bacterium]
AEAGRDTLVVIFQRGACDGLSLLAPYEDANYHKARPTIGVKPGQAIPVEDGWGLHPNLAPLAPFFADGLGAAVVGAGIVDLPVRSHFEAMDEIERGNRAVDKVTGWLGRYVMTTPANGDAPFRVVASSGSPTSLRGAEPVTSLAGAAPLSLPNAAVTHPILEALYRPTSGGPAVGTAGAAAFDLIDLTRTLFAGAYTPDAGAAYGTSSFSQLLRAAARVIKADLGTEIITVDAGGWDTHFNMGAVGSGGVMDQLANDFGSSLGAFLTDLADHLDRITVLVVTEFGRQVAQNSTGGLDHGEGSVMFAFGGGVNGGVHGLAPDLSPGALVDNAYLATTDYRDVFAEALSLRMGASALDRILPGHTAAPLGLFRR